MSYLKVNGHYTVIAEFDKQYILCKNMLKDAPEPYVIWHVSDSGDTYGGRYFADRTAAEKVFCELCFDWFEGDAENMNCDDENGFEFQDALIGNVDKSTVKTVEDIRQFMEGFNKMCPL
ncbi:MAG: hypothetical protein RR806_07080 [Oscillospiraceae bacterium]